MRACAARRVAVVHTDNLNPAANPYFLSHDAMGTPRRVLVRGTLAQHRRLVMDAWGQARLYPGVNTPPNSPSSSVPSATDINVYLPHRLPGQLQGPGEPVVENRYRYYVPTLGQYLTPDPMHQASVMTPGPQAYAYANGNPLRYRDPTGALVQVRPCVPVVHEVTRNVVRQISEGGASSSTAEFAFGTDLDCDGCELKASFVVLRCDIFAATYEQGIGADLLWHEQRHVGDMNSVLPSMAALIDRSLGTCDSEVDCWYKQLRLYAELGRMFEAAAVDSQRAYH
jgi:RHS repeat-associated protein